MRHRLRDIDIGGDVDAMGEHLMDLIYTDAILDLREAEGMLREDARSMHLIAIPLAMIPAGHRLSGIAEGKAFWLWICANADEATTKLDQLGLTAAQNLVNLGDCGFPEEDPEAFPNIEEGDAAFALTTRRLGH